jgi:DNA-binding response OmpR family regulator
VPVIMLTAREDVEYKRKASQLFDEAYLTKPVEFAVLKSTIEEVLRRRGKM